MSHPIQTSLPIPTLGEMPGTDDIQYFKTLSSAVEHMILGDKNPLWNDEMELHQARSLSFVQPLTAIQGTLNDRIARRFPLADMNQPRDPLAVLQAAYRYSRESPFVAKAGRVKAEFTLPESFVHQTQNTAVADFYNQKAEDLNLQLITLQILFAAYTIGIVPIWWGGEETRDITNIELLDPRVCHIEYNFGKPTLYLKIDEKMRQAVADPEGKLDIRNRMRFQSMPRYWVAQIVEQKQRGVLNGLIQLQEGSYAVVDVRLSKISTSMGSMDGLPIQPAFEALQQYRLLAAGDYAAAWNLKNMITLISEGDPKAEGKDWKPISMNRLNNLQATFQRADTNYVVYCDPTTKIEFAVPPVDVIFGTNKYVQREKEIKEIVGLPSFMWVSEQGANYSNASNEVNAFDKDCSIHWMMVKAQFLKPFYARLRETRARPGFQLKDIVYPEYNNRTLQDATEMLKSHSELYGRGVMSLKSLQEYAGLDHEYEMQQMAKEHEKWGNKSTGQPGEPLNDTIASPLFEPSQGNMNPARDTGGNPRTSSNPNKSEAGQKQSPRPGGS